MSVVTWVPREKAKIKLLMAVLHSTDEIHRPSSYIAGVP